MTRRNIWVIFLAAIVSLACYHKAQRNRFASVFGSTLSLIGEEYVEEVDQRKLFDAAMEGMVSQLDKYSNYINPEDFKQFQVSIDQEFIGIGIEVRLDPETKRLTVLSPLVGTPAYLAGIRAGDIITKIDGKSCEGLELKDAVGLLRGKKGTPVTMAILHRGEEEPVDIRVVRDTIQVASVLGDTRRKDGSWNFFLEENPRIGYVRINTFGEHTTEELRKALKFEHQPIDALILDLRGNPGGLLLAAVDACDMFIDQGVIVSTRGRGGRPVEGGKYEAHPSKTIVPADIPVVVLVNQGSASASEIVAACLQDHRRAIVVGERTWGKGTVQNVIHLEGGQSVLKLTTASYWRPNNHNIHRTSTATEEDDWGVMPDDGYLVTMSEEEAERVYLARRDRDILNAPGSKSPAPVTEEVAMPVIDPQLRKAVEYLQQRLDEIDARGRKA